MFVLLLRDAGVNTKSDSGFTHIRLSFRVLIRMLLAKASCHRYELASCIVVWRHSARIPRMNVVKNSWPALVLTRAVLRLMESIDQQPATLSGIQCELSQLVSL